MIPSNPTLVESIKYTGEPDGVRSGVLNDGIGHISSVFDRQIRDGLHPGAQLVVLRFGQVLLDRSGGYAEMSKKHPMTPETQFLTFSLTKPYTSACIFKLIEAKEIDLDAPVGLYWPEFSCNGKEEITVKQVLLHQTGLSKNRLVYQILNISDWQTIIKDLAKQKPGFFPGTRTGYQFLNYGFILGEVIHRVTGFPVDEYLQREFLTPLGLTQTSMRVMDFQKNRFSRLSSGTIDHQLVAWIFNSERVRGSLIPAASLHSTARDIAIFYQMLLNNGEYAGRRFLESETVKFATSLGYEGFDESLGRINRWGYGFFLGGDHTLNPDYPDGMGKGSSLDTFGHYGQRNSMVWADKRTGLVVVFLCNHFLSSFDNKIRLQEISDVVWDEIDG